MSISGWPGGITPDRLFNTQLRSSSTPPASQARRGNWVITRCITRSADATIRAAAAAGGSGGGMCVKVLRLGYVIALCRPVPVRSR